MPITTAQVIAPFITPALAWAGVAMVSVPVVIHLLSRWRRRPEPWGAMRFLLEAYRKQKRRMHLEQWLLLLLRCLIVLLLGLALARPLLVGVIGSWLGGLDSRGRTVHIVIDDAMSLRASDGPDATRFDRLIDTADSVIDALEPGDRATLWRAGRPAGPVIAEPTADRTHLRAALARLRPGYNRPDMPGVLSMIADSDQERQDGHAQSVTYILSDFVRSARYVNELPAADPAADQDTHARVVLRPLLGLDNLQVSSVKPLRRVVWVGGSSANSVATEVGLARYAEDLPSASVGLTVELIDTNGRGLSSIRRRVVFADGQSDTTLGIDLPISALPSWLDARGGALLTIRAYLDSDTDTLSADNRAHGTVELRRRMRVAVVDEPGGALLNQDTGLTPGQWVSLALNPRGIGSAGAVEVVPLAPSALNDLEAFEVLDAVMLLRPDRVIRPGWDELSLFAEAGGLVWVFTPPDEGASPWVSLMTEFFDPGWRVGLEAVEAGGGVGAEDNTASLGLAGKPLTAEPLERLAADWQALIQPIHVQRYLPLSADGADAWVSLAPTRAAQTDDESEDAINNTLLAHRRVGMGSLLMLSTAMDTRWTNLPTKPLFVPLIHETLLGVLGTRDRPGVVHAVSGDQPVLSPAWSGVTALERLESGYDPVVVEQDGAIELKTGEAGVALAGPVTLPGVYQANTDAGPRRLVVDPDPLAGDTRRIDEKALTRWLDGLGDWRWLNENDPGEALRRSGDVADIGWVLLWVVLALVLVESVTSRLLSHAGAERSRSLTAQLWRAAIRARSGDKTDTRGGRAA
jgi:aerotolerance regulator-like protein/VWA domain-containing protein